MSILLPYLKKQSPWYLLGFICIFATNWLAVQIPKLVGEATDLITTSKQSNPQDFSQTIGLIFLFALCMIIVRTLSRVFILNPGRNIEMHIKNDMFSKLTSFEREYYEANPKGTAISKMNNDIHGVRMLCGFCTMQTFNFIFAFTLTPLMMWQISSELTLYCLWPIILIFTLVNIGMHFIIRSTRERQLLLQDLTQDTISQLSAIDVIKGFNLHEWSNKEFGKSNQNMHTINIKLAWMRTCILPLLDHMETIIKIIILWFGLLYIIDGILSPGDVAALFLYATMINNPLRGLGWLIAVFQQGKVSLESIGSILNRVHHEKCLKTENKQNHIGLEIRDLSFQYHEDETTVLKNINLNIKPGQTVGILGNIGSGKTTLVNCINRYLQVEQGHIFFDDIEINSCSRQLWREHIKTVTQEPFLFSDTVEANITFGRNGEDLDRESFNQVIEQCALKEEIKRFPQHEQTLVGEKGIMLSGGQKQRISLARALTDPCRLLILDNVLSAVDYDTERHLLDAIYNNQKAESLLIISHRVSVLEKADQILVMENGAIIAQGRHHELINSCDTYRNTWDIQNQDRNQEVRS